MKDQNNRVRRDGDKKAGRKQPSKTTDKAPGKSGGQSPGRTRPDKVSLIFMSEEEGLYLGGVDLLPGEFEAVQKAAAAHNESLSAWFNRFLTGVLKDAEAELKSTRAAAKGGVL